MPSMEILGTVESLWRYPVKSLAGEQLDRLEIAADGVPGDRARALFVESGHARAGKTYRGKEHHLLHTTSEPAQAERYARDAGVVTQLRNGTHFFDAAPVSLLFDIWVAEVSGGVGRALDFRRWRPNIYARAGESFQENDLIGTLIEAGTALLRVRAPIERCVTPNYDIATGESDPQVLRYVAQKRDTNIGVYCDVELAGVVRAEDVLRLRAR